MVAVMLLMEVAVRNEHLEAAVQLRAGPLVLKDRSRHLVEVAMQELEVVVAVEATMVVGEALLMASEILVQVAVDLHSSVPFNLESSSISRVQILAMAW